MPDIGYYTLPVIPSFRGTEARLGGDLNRAFGKAGTDAGTSLTKAAAQKIRDDKSIESAMESKAKAADKLALAISRTKQAQATLTQTEAAGNIAGHTRAVEALAQARTREAAAIRGVSSATSGLNSAMKTAKANAEQAAQGGGGGNAGMMGLMMMGRGGLQGLSMLSSTAGTVAGTAAKAGIAGVLTVAAGAALFAPIFAGVKLFNWGAEVGLPLERTMNTLQGVTNATGAQMSAAGQVARQLGSDIHLSGVTAADAAAAMTELAKGGLDVNQAMAAARGTVQLATAGNLEAADAAKYQTAALNMFQLGADKAGHVADLFAAAANSSSAEVSDLGMALQQGGSVAAGFGLSIEETMSVLAGFSKLGINASDAGTMMKTSMQAITDQGNPAQGAIQDLGLQLYDTQGKFVGYTNMMTQVANASQHMTQEQFQAATSILFGSDAMRASMIAAKGGPELFQGTADAMQHVDGAAARMAAAQMHGLPGVLAGLSNTVDSMKLSVYDAGNAIMTALGQQALGGLSGLANWIAAHQPQVVGFFTAVGTYAVTAAESLLQFVADSSKALAQLVNVIGDTYGATTRATAAVQRFLGHEDKANALDKQADAAFGWADGIYKIADAAQGGVDKLEAFKAKLQTAGDQANNAAKFTVALGTAVATVPDGKDIIITDNTPETTSHLQALGISVEQTPTGLKITATTDEAKQIIEAWRRQQGLEPVDIKVVPAIDPDAAARMKAFFDQYKTIMTGGPPVVLPGGGPVPSAAPPNMPTLGGHPFAGHAAGGVFSAFGRMPTDAIIQPARPGLIQWAEPSTRGEAYIPLGGGRRSRDIWLKTGGLLGIPGFDAGAITLPDVQAAVAMQGSPYSQGVRSDCSGMVARVILSAMGLGADAGLMSTKTAGTWLAKYGFKPGVGGPGTITVGWYDHGPNPNDGHMAMTLSNGMHAEAGGSHGEFLVGQGAAGADNPEFDQHMFLPVAGMFPQGPGTTGAGFNTGGAGGGAGGTPGTGPGGQAGTYTVDQTKVADAEKKVRDADANVAIQEQQVKELKATAAESQKMTQNEQLRKAKEDAASARDDLAKAKQGDFTAGKDTTGAGGQGGPGDVSAIGGIASQFMKDTFGFGDWLPDPSKLGIVKLLNAIMGIKYTPQGTNFKGGLLEGMAAPPAFGGGGIGGGGGGGGDPFAAIATSMLPFGMSNIPGIVDPLQPGGIPPPMPVDDQHLPPGGPNAPGPVTVDQSNNVTVQGYSSNDVATKVRRELQWAPRVTTYTPPGLGG